jgi:hypothetical protein
MPQLRALPSEAQQESLALNKQKKSRQTAWSIAWPIPRALERRLLLIGVGQFAANAIGCQVATVVATSGLNGGRYTTEFTS